MGRRATLATMRFALMLVGVTVGSALAGCATDADGCSTDTCRAQQAIMRTQYAQSTPEARERAAAESRQRTMAENCARAESNPAAADPRTVHWCRALRWESSGIACTDNRVADRVVEVTCETPIRSGYADSRTTFEMIEERAAVATLAAGFTHLVFSGEEPPQPRYAAGLAAPQPTSTTFRHRYEMLTETEALGRVNPNVPLPRQPKSAVEVTYTYSP